MDSAKDVLHSIVSTTQQLRNASAEYSTTRGVRQVQQHSLVRLESDFQTITNASRAILVVLDDPSLCRHYMLDDRLVTWLSSAEPEACLHALREMGKLLSVGPARHELQAFSGFAPRSVCEEDEIHAAIVLFHAHKAHFHFLLTSDIWNHQNVIHRQTMARNVEEGQSHGHRRPQSTQMQNMLAENVRKEIISQKLRRLLKFLGALDCSVKHRGTLSMRQSDTCMWLPATDVYRSWREGKTSSILWLQGKAGAGKSVLASSVIDDLSNTINHGELLAYFYCDFRIGQSTSAMEVMRSILAQLAAQLTVVGLDPEGLLDELLKESDSHVERFYNVKGLSRYICKVAGLCHRPPIVVVDALDECREAESLLDGLILSAGDLRIFATSRPLQNIVNILSPFPCISMDKMAAELSTDILLHITRELDSRRRLRTFGVKLKEEILVKLCAKADGMFRWVQCQIDTLEKCSSVSEIRRVLESLPEGLEETYRRILIAIDRCLPDARIVRRALVWLVTALRPMRMDELLEAVMINPDYRALDSRFRLMKGADLLEACRSLVIHHEGTDIITLSHMSVKEYLVGELVRAKLPQYSIVVEDAHELLARLCMGYIAFCLEEMGEPSDRSSSVTRQRRIIPTTTSRGPRPLLKYVFSHGFGHLSQLGPDNAGIFEDLKALQVLILRRTQEWDQLCNMVPSVRSGTPWPTSRHDFTLYTLIAFAPDALLRTHISSTALMPREGTNPLIYAAYFGKAEHAKILISRGVDINLGGLIVDAMVTNYSDADIVDMDHLGEDDSDSDMSDSCDDSDHETTPLEAAVDRWHAEIVDLLFTEGCIIPDRLLARVLGKRPQDFPLYIISRLLETRAFAKWATTPWEYRGLLEAIVDDAEDHGEDGRDELVLALRRLVEVGCAETLLLLAVEKGCILVVEALLTMNISPALGVSSASHIHATVNALSPNGDTPLHLAMRLSSEVRCLTITKLLVRVGCSPCERDANDKLPIQIAVARGFISVVEHLISQEAPLPSRILFAALQVTLLKRVEMIRFLISKGALVRVLNSDHDTLLHVAMRSLDRSICLEIAEMLIGAGCNPSGRNLRGETPLHIAAKQGYYEVVNYLLLSDTSVNVLSLLHSDNSTRTSALRSLIGNPDGLRFGPDDEDRTLQAVRRFVDDEDKCLELAKCFVEAADNLFSHSSSSATLIDIAVIRGFTRVVEYLVSVAVPLPSRILFTTLRHQPNQPKIIRFLVSKGADLHLQDDDGNTLLHVTISTFPEPQCCEIVRLLVEIGCPTEMVNATGLQPIQIAVSRGFSGVAGYLLSHAVAPLPPDLLFTALQLREPSSMVRLLLAHGASVSCHAPGGDHLLHVVLKTLCNDVECLQVARMLVEAGCSCVVPDTAGKMPLHNAITRGFTSVADYLLSQDVPLPSDILTYTLELQTIFYMNRRHDWTLLFNSLLQRGANLHERDACGNTLIHLAMRLYAEPLCLEVTKDLIHAGCSLSTHNSEGELPIQRAVSRGLATVVEYLLSQHAPFPPDILLTAAEGRNAFHREVLRMVSLLVKHGADVRVLAPNGDTALHVTLEYVETWLQSKDSCLLDVVKILVQHGCDVCARDARGRTASDVAVANGYLEVAEYLDSLLPPIPPPPATSAVRRRGQSRSVSRTSRQPKSNTARRLHQA